MTFYATFDSSGRLSAFYDSRLHGDDGIPEGAVGLNETQYRELAQNQDRWRYSAGFIAPFEPVPPTLTVSDYSDAIQVRLDEKARERRYDSIQTAITYRDDPNAQFAAEGLALFQWRSAVWTFSSAEMAKVVAGERVQPSVAEFLNELEVACPFVWPMEHPVMAMGGS